jgi:hypothetical protein
LAIEDVTVTINTLPAAATVRQPRAIVRLNGDIVPGWVSWDVDNNSYFEADTWRVSFATSALPQANNADWFSQQTETFVEIIAGFPEDPDKPDPSDPAMTSLIYGRIDEIRYDPVKTLIDLKGRDLTAAFIDNKLTASYWGQFSSSIVTEIAKSHGFFTGNITATKTKPGVLYQPDQVLLWADRSEWDLLCALARQQKFVCFMTGAGSNQSLYFGPDPLPDSNPYAIQWTPPDENGFPNSNALSIDFSRSQTVSRGITVTVSSASLTYGKTVTASYPSAPRAIQPGKATPFGNVQPYPYAVEDGLTPQECEQRAEALYHQIIAHEMKLEARLPGDNLLTTRRMLKVSGTGTAFDQLYFPRLVTRSMSKDEGYVMTVTAQNQSPEQPT